MRDRVKTCIMGMNTVVPQKLTGMAYGCGYGHLSTRPPHTRIIYILFILLHKNISYNFF